MTAALDIERHVAALGADELAHLAASLRARAAERRKSVTVEEAWDVYNMVPDLPDWSWLGFQECGRVRKALEILVGWRGFHPEQVVSAVTEVALEVCAPWAGAVEVIANEAVAAGIADGMFYREDLEDDDD